MNTVWTLESWRALPPYVDKGTTTCEQLGYYETLDAAVAWIRSPSGKERLFSDDPDDGVTLLLYASEYPLNEAAMTLRVITLDPTGQRLSPLRPSGFDEAWDGRPSETCRWAPGQIVAVYDGSYRIGVVLAQPPSPTWIGQHPGIGVTWGDDVYLVGFRGTTNDHAHPAEYEIFEPLGPVPRELQLELKRRFDEFVP